VQGRRQTETSVPVLLPNGDSSIVTVINNAQGTTVATSTANVFVQRM
jgi:hypothetical protein